MLLVLGRGDSSEERRLPEKSAGSDEQSDVTAGGSVEQSNEATDGSSDDVINSEALQLPLLVTRIQLADPQIPGPV